MGIQGCDLSENNSWPGDGYDFYILRTAFGANHLDSKYASFLANVQRLNKPWGAYFFMLAGQTVSLQVSAHLRMIGTDQPPLGHWVDYESFHGSLPTLAQLQSALALLPEPKGYYSNLVDYRGVTDVAWWFANPSNNPPPRPVQIQQTGINVVDQDIIIDEQWYNRLINPTPSPSTYRSTDPVFFFQDTRNNDIYVSDGLSKRHLAPDEVGALQFIAVVCGQPVTSIQVGHIPNDLIDRMATVGAP